MYALYFKVRWYVGMALLLCLAITVAKYSAWIDYKLFGRSKRPTNVAQQPVQAGSQPPSPVTPSSVQAANAPSASADVLTQLGQAKSLLDEAATDATEALKQVLRWQSDVEPLRDQTLTEPASAATDGEGSEADDLSKLFDRLAYVMRRERTSAQELRDVATQIESWQIKIDNLLKQPIPAALSAVDMADVSQLRAMCKQAKDNWQRDVEQALAIKHLLDTHAETATNVAPPTTIGRKISDADAKAALIEIDEQIVHEEEEEAAKQARAAELAEQRHQKQEEDAELLAKATSPEVKALLAPFLEARSIQPSLAGTLSIKWIRTNEKKPMSLGKLMAIGALDDSVLGRQKLASVVGERKLPEPKWSIASQPNSWSPEDESRLKQAQEMLRNYGRILVQAGMLSE